VTDGGGITLVTEVSQSYAPIMEVGVLGPLRVTGASGELIAPGAKERAVLAFLVARVRQVVTSNELVDALWPDDPPRTATRTLHSYVARLRALLNPAGSVAESPIRTEGRGYRLVMEPDDIDSHRFARLADLGHTALSEGRAAVAAETLAGALALWRGPPYVGFESTGFGRTESYRCGWWNCTALCVRTGSPRDCPAVTWVQSRRISRATSRRTRCVSPRGPYWSGRTLRPVARLQRWRPSGEPGTCSLRNWVSTSA